MLRNTVGGLSLLPAKEEEKEEGREVCWRGPLVLPPSWQPVIKWSFWPATKSKAVTKHRNGPRKAPLSRSPVLAEENDTLASVTYGGLGPAVAGPASRNPRRPSG
ncbi:hypothetical protein L249_6031, partial [Ophiocordyceps polyrhachis-furcata BCC 54312]